MSGNDNNEIKDALAAVQQEQNDDEIHANDDDKTLDEQILNGLPDDEVIEDKATEEKVTKQSKKPKVKKPKSKNKSPSKLIALGLVAALVISGTAIWHSGLFASNPTVSFPKAGGWKIFGESTNDENPYITKSDLESFERKLRSDVLQTVSQLPSVKDIEYLRNEISTLRQLQNRQSKYITELNMLADKTVTERPLMGSNYDSQISLIRAELNELNNFTGELLSKTAKLDENAANFKEASKKIDELTNSNWLNHLQLKKLEKQVNNSVGFRETQSSNKSTGELKNAESITLKPKIEWVLKIVSERFSQIQHKQTGEKIRVFEGVVIPNCGPVIDIDVQARKVVAQHCTIGHR